MNCLHPNCETEPSGDYPACSTHAETLHFTNRECRCKACKQEAERRAAAITEIEIYKAGIEGGLILRKVAA